MKTEKLENYKLVGSIHTLSIKTDRIIEEIQPELARCIKSSTQTRNDITTTTSIINPNKLVGDIYAYSDFKTALDTILVGSGIFDYKIVRADMRLDSTDSEHYRQYAKLNRYLISALAVTYKVKNVYKTENLFTQKQLSVAIKNDYFEVENYDKEAESRGLDIAASRLEQRSKRWRDNDLKREFVNGWSYRWDKAINNLDLVHKTYNDALEKLYKENKNVKPIRYRSLTDFIIQHQDCIFCNAQMIDLLSRFPEEVRTPKNRAKHHKAKYGIEYFSKSDVKKAVKEIKRATKEFYKK